MKPIAVIMAGCGLASAFAIRPPSINKPSLPGLPVKPDTGSTWDSACDSASTYANKYAKWKGAPCTSIKPSSVVPSVVPSSVVVSSIPISSISVSVPSSAIPSISVSIPSSVIPSVSVSVPVSSIIPSSIISSIVPSSSIVEPPVRTCELGTAMGYQSESESVTLNRQSGNGCNRWGWYQMPTLAELQAGISGILYVGAGGNNIDNAINVGDWTAVASPTGGVTFTYALDAGYFLDEVHIDLDCLPIDTCAPGQYTFNSGALPNVPVYVNPTPLQYPVCSGGSEAYFILHGSVNYITTESTCAPPVAT